MFLDLENLPPEGEAVDRSIDAASLSIGGDDFRLASGVELTGFIQPVDSDEEGVYRLRGSMFCQIEVACVRCLEPFLMDVREELDLLYLPQSKNVAPRSHHGEGGEGEARVEDPCDRGLDADEVAASFYKDRRIDLGQMILEQIVLALPMKPLCKADCRGLCPECGANRNTTSCACAPEDTDPRWATLKTLLGR